MGQTCQASGVSFTVDQEELDFLEKVSPSFNGKKSLLPPPTFSPEERVRRRLAYRNLRSLYKRTCDATGKAIISPYPADSPHKVYYADYWWSDSWDGLSYGRPFDFNRPFFEQFAELYRAVPVIHHFASHNENCEYVNGAANCRDCYLSFDMDYCEHCLYLSDGKKCQYCVDCLAITGCELCYECIHCENCYGLQYSTRCVGCYDSFFLSECRQCRYCIGCSNLANKEYYIFNQKSTREEYQRICALLQNFETIQQYQQKALAHHRGYPRKSYFGHSNENFSGDNLHHSKNSHFCFDAFELENCRYCDYVFHAANCMDYTVFGDHSEWIYNCQATGINCSFDICCNYCWAGSSNNLYCHLINATSDCFGCSGLKQKQYCILNTQYTAEEYNKLVPKIIEHMRKTGEWGQFFPPALSPFGVNETVANDYYPISEADALARGYRWTSPPEPAMASLEKVIPATIEEVDDSICNSELRCESSGRAYRVTKQELKFYRKMAIPLPRQCPELRHQRRFAQKNPRRLWKRQCAKTNVDIWTTYDLEKGDLVYSDKAYLEAMD